MYVQRHTYIEVEEPQGVIEYNCFMDGVDLSDMITVHYLYATKHKNF